MEHVPYFSIGAGDADTSCPKLIFWAVASIQIAPPDLSWWTLDALSLPPALAFFTLASVIGFAPYLTAIANFDTISTVPLLVLVASDAGYSVAVSSRRAGPSAIAFVEKRVALTVVAGASQKEDVGVAHILEVLVADGEIELSAGVEGFEVLLRLGCVF